MFVRWYKFRHWIFNKDLSFELKSKVEKIFETFSQKIEKNYSEDEQIDVYYKLSNMAKKIRDGKRSDMYQLFDYLWIISNRKACDLTWGHCWYPENW